MAWTKVKWYALGFNIVDKQGYFYYCLEGQDIAHEVVVSASELTALADMFRNDGPIMFNSDGHYFATNHERIAESQVQRAGSVEPSVA